MDRFKQYPCSLSFDRSALHWSQPNAHEIHISQPTMDFTGAPADVLVGINSLIKTTDVAGVIVAKLLLTGTLGRS